MPQSEAACFRFRLPVPPSANALFTTRFGSRQRIKTDAYLAWRREAGTMLMIADRPADSIKHARIEIAMPVNYQRDIDNTVKPIIDLLVLHGVLLDDRWVDDLRVVRVPVGVPLVVYVWGMGDVG